MNKGAVYTVGWDETEKHIARLLDLRDALAREYEPTSWDACDAAIKALRACEAIRTMCTEEREAGYCHADLDTLEELLP